MINIQTSDSVLSVQNSYLINSSKQIKQIIKQFKEDFPKHSVCKVSSYLLLCEWLSHNLCYQLNIQRDRTKDVDFKSERTWYADVVYYIVGTICNIFI